MVGIPLAFADLYTLSIYRQTSTKSATTGKRSFSLTLNGSVVNIDVQPVDSETRQALEGSRKTVQYYFLGTIQQLISSMVTAFSIRWKQALSIQN